MASESRRINIYVNQKLANKSIKDLTSESRKLNNEIKQLTPGTEAYKKKLVELKATNSVLKKHRQEVYNVESGWGKMKKTLGPLAGMVGGVFAVGKLISFGKELIEIQRRALGVNYAFNQLGEEGEVAFEKIREATRGTLSDLDIKTSINEFSNFNISLKESGTLFEFLAVRAAQTGKSVDELRSSLVEGLSKESKLRIDNLGISAMELNEELEQTPDFVQAVANIAKREIAEAGDVLDTATTSQAKLNAEIENSKESIANNLGPAWDNFLSNTLSGIDRMIKAWKNWTLTKDEKIYSEGEQSRKDAVADYERYIGRMIDLENNKRRMQGKIDLEGEELKAKRLEIARKNQESFTRESYDALHKINKARGKTEEETAKELGEKLSYLEGKTYEEQRRILQLRVVSIEDYADSVVAAEKKKEADLEKSRKEARAREWEQGREDREKKAEQLQRELSARAERLRSFLEAENEKNRINESEDPELEKIKARYQAQIDEATELEKRKGKIGDEALVQRNELEKLRDAEIDAYREERAEEENLKREETKIALAEELMSDYELEVFNLDNHYQNLIQLAESYGLDTTGIIAKYEAEALRIKQENDQKQVESEEDKAKRIQQINITRLEAQAQLFNAIGDLSSNFYDFLKTEGEENIELQRLFTLTKIAFDTAAAISSVVAAAASTSLTPIDMAVKIVSGIGTVVANMAQAKSIMTAEQKAEGGYTEGESYSVRGADDGKVYSAKYNARPKAGMMYDPTLVLAAEQGPEYYVPNPLLSNPTVAHHVREIDAIRTGKQFAEGGYDTPENTSATTTTSNSTKVISGQNLSQLATVVGKLNAILSNGIYARIEGNTIDDIFSTKQEQDEVRGN